MSCKSKSQKSVQKVFTIQSIYQDSLPNLFSTFITILECAKTECSTILSIYIFCFGGKISNHFFRAHSPLSIPPKSLLLNPAITRPARCQQQCTNHQEPQEGEMVWLPVGRAFRWCFVANSFDKIFWLR